MPTCTSCGNTFHTSLPGIASPARHRIIVVIGSAPREVCTMLVLCGRLRVRPLHVSRSTAIPDVSHQLGSDRPTCMRLNYPLLLRATRPPDTDRAIRTLLGSLSQPRSCRPVRVTRSVTAWRTTTHWGSSATRQRSRPLGTRRRKAFLCSLPSHTAAPDQVTTRCRNPPRDCSTHPTWSDASNQTGSR